MASRDEPSIDVGLSPGREDTGNTIATGFGQLGEGRPRPVPDLEFRFPSFAPDDSLVDGTPSGEVQLRVPRRIEHVGEPAPTTLTVPGARTKENDDLIGQIASMQAALKVISARLENQNVNPQPNRDAVSTHSYNRSSSMPTVHDRSVIGDPQHMSSRLGPMHTHRDRSLSPNNRYASDTIPRSTYSSPLHYESRSKCENIKVAVYDGKTSWKDYLVQFELAARANKWDKATSAVRLACSLRGSAQSLLSDITPDVRYDYDLLVTALTNRFEPENQCEIYKAQIKQRIRKRDEPLTELAQDIKRLTRMAYPSAVQDLRDTLAKDCFIEALNDVEMEMFICQKEPDTMEDAIRVALKYEAFSQGRRKRLMSNKTGIRMQHESSSTNTFLNDDIREIKEDLKDLKTANKPQPGGGWTPQDGRKCYICGDNTHLQRSCPRKNNLSGNPTPLLSGYQSGNRNGRYYAMPNNQSTESNENVNRSWHPSSANRYNNRNRNQENRQ